MIKKILRSTKRLYIKSTNLIISLICFIARKILKNGKISIKIGINVLVASITVSFTKKFK